MFHMLCACGAAAAALCRQAGPGAGL